MSSSSVEDLPEQYKDIFTQDGVTLKACIGRPTSDINLVGMLCIVEYPDQTKGIEWRPNDLITIDSDTQEQEWAVVNTLGRRKRTESGSLNSEYVAARARILRLPLKELKAFKIALKNHQLHLTTKMGMWQMTFYFQHGNAEVFTSQIQLFLKTAKTRQDKNHYVVMEPTVDVQALNRSFAELDIFTENTTDVVWNWMSNFKQRPYETSLEAFSKLTDIVYYSNDVNGTRLVSEEVVDLLTKSMNGIEGATQVTKTDEYEVISMKPTLPPRPSMPRGTELSAEHWEGLQDPFGRVTEVEGVKLLIFRGGISYSIRRTVWKYLLDYYPWHMTTEELRQLRKTKTSEYYRMKSQWKTISDAQEQRFSEYRDRKSLVEKDVSRTDRTHPFYAGEDNQNLVILQDILMTYVMYNFDLGYVQGMSDILAPLLLLFQDEVDAFWCFVGFMEKIASNFDIDQAGMKLQLNQLQELLAFANPELAKHMSQKDSGNMYFCFRWLLVWFKREFKHIDIMRLWEVLWTGLPCKNFHLLICVAILDAEKDVFIERDYGFTEILKHVNDLSMSLNVDKILSSAEGIFHQMKSALHLTDPIRIILGMEPLNLVTSTNSEEEASKQTNGHVDNTDREEGY